MDIGLALSLAGIAIIIAGVIYFFILPDEEEQQQPVESPGGGGEDDPVDRPVDGPEEPIDRPIEYPDDPVGPGNPIPEEPELVENLDIPSRAKNILLENNLKTVAEIRHLDENLEEVEGIGDSYAEDIRRAIREE